MLLMIDLDLDLDLDLELGRGALRSTAPQLMAQSWGGRLGNSQARRGGRLEMLQGLINRIHRTWSEELVVVWPADLASWPPRE